MSKKDKGKICVYCGNANSASGDHVFAKEFFLPPDRVNLPQVPACVKCNNDKSKLEHYLTSVLPFSGRHSSAEDNLKTMVPKRLDKNERLRCFLAQTLAKLWIKDSSGLHVPTSLFPIDHDQIQKFFEMIAKGLLWYHWKTYLTSEHDIKVIFLTEAGEKFFDETFQTANVAAHVEVNLGNGTVIYEGIQRNRLSRINCLALVNLWRSKDR